MADVREPAVAGSFYPADPGDLRQAVERLLAEAPPTDIECRALIAPHAGYAYSGPIAASAFKAVAGRRGSIRRVVLVGPSHFVPFAGLALPEATAFRTPLGEVPLDLDGVAAATDHAVVGRSIEAHRREHCLEVELPFLQAVLGDFEIVPLVTGQATPEAVAALIEALWEGPETLVVASSDLSHYHGYETAHRLDQATARTIVAGRHEELEPASACGRLAVQGLLLAARSRGLGATLLDLRSSGDTAGPRDEVVGYGAFAFA
jgi:AmmeMemoRadiSam system protein B